jgi:glycosyltransferase involved in cell wall biosynthesis
MPEVSVVIPAFNAARFLRAAIDSVLAQTFTSVEIIVVDDGSTDATGEIVGSYGGVVSGVYQQNSGVAAARNAGIARSVGRYVAFLDADDVWAETKLERQLEALAAEPACRACYSALKIVDLDLRPLRVQRGQRQSSALEDLLVLGNVVGTPSSVICERDVLEACGGFDPALSYAADWDLWLRLAAKTEFLYVDTPLVMYRQHSSAMSGDLALIERDNLHLLDKAFARLDLPTAVRVQRARALGRNYRVLSGIYFQAHRYLDAVRCATHAVIRDPRQAGYIAALPLRRLRNVV